MRDVNGWYIFWMANFAVAGSAFAVITLIVLVLGIRDLRAMFAGLRGDRPAEALVAPRRSSRSAKASAERNDPAERPR